jgi:hypothetical protein
LQGLQDLVLLKPINRRFKFEKRRQLFIGMHNETLSVSAMRVSNPDGSPVGIKTGNCSMRSTGQTAVV